MRAGLLVLAALGLLAGCTRARYRQWADRQTYPILQERIVYPTYDIGRTLLEPDPAARISDPFNEDFPPKPPDDPAAALFMERPGYMRGSQRWGIDGYTDIIEPPGWELVLQPDEKGIVHLNQDKSVEVALLDSREYQTQLETLYLTALALTLNRFEFQMQWFLVNNTNFTHFGSGGTPNGETNTLTSNTDFGFSRNFAAGGQFLTDFANSLVYEYTGGTQTVKSNWLFSLVQPLLRRAGRKVRLESLTQQERNVLYSVRTFARFRKNFWAGVAMGNGTGNGYLGLLLSLQTLRNQEANLKRQEETYRLLNELFLGGRRSAVELDQVYLQLQQARFQVVSSQKDLNTSLDLFKLQLGLPPRLQIELDDSFLDAFILVDEELERMRDGLEAMQRQRLAELDEPPSLEALRDHFHQLLSVTERSPEMLERAKKDVARWSQRLERPLQPQDDRDALERAKDTYDLIAPQMPGIADDLQKTKDKIVLHQQELREETRKQSWEALVDDIKDLLADIDGMVAIQTQARIHLIELPAVEINADEALVQAKENRLDLQNQLGQVTDAWRKVTVVANALKADLDVVASANLGTDPDHLNPLNFAAEASTYTLGLHFDGPLNRLAERNAYRASLIFYQQARRDYMKLSDGIELQIRNDMRNLNLSRVGFEVSRQQLLSAARQYEGARIALLAPRDRQQAANSANDASTLNLLGALTSLLNARNGLAQNYINYEQQRVQLVLDLEQMQLDPRGFPLRDSLRTTGAPQPGPAEEIPLPEPGAVQPAPFDPARGGDPEPDVLPAP